MLKTTHEVSASSTQYKTDNGVPFYDADVVGGDVQVANEKVISSPSYYIDLAKYRDSQTWLTA